MRAVIYARYSSDLQREASIEDQVEVCRRYIERNGWTPVAVYEDRALSGGSTMRPDYQRMLIGAAERKFDIVVCEALDRLGRRLADIAALHDQMVFHNVRLFAASTGEITPMHVGMMGTMAQMYLSDLREKTKRGQLGRALKGRIPGGKAYGYDVLPGTQDGAGERRINEAEAAVIRRIFGAYADGESPRGIAKRLNADGVAGPGGRQWRDTTIRSQVDRGTEILNNALYVGRLEWYRCSYVKDPRTGKRVARPNPREAWEIIDVPHLRIISDELWERVRHGRTYSTSRSRGPRTGNPLIERTGENSCYQVCSNVACAAAATLSWARTDTAAPHTAPWGRARTPSRSGVRRSRDAFSKV